MSWPFYPSTEWEMDQPFICNCGSPKCQQFIGGAYSFKPEVILQYQLTNYIKKERSVETSKALWGSSYLGIMPSVISQDPNITYYYDFSRVYLSIRVFEELNLSWTGNMLHYTITRKWSLQSKKSLSTKDAGLQPLWRWWSQWGARYQCNTGTEKFGLILYRIKRIFLWDDHLENSKWKGNLMHVVSPMHPPGSHTAGRKNVKGLFDRLPGPLIIKPAVVSGGSMGASEYPMWSTMREECLRIIDKINEGYRGWNLTVDGILQSSLFQVRSTLRSW